MKKKIPVFVYKKYPEQEGNGYYSMVACFVALGVHVPFNFYAHSENEYLESVGKPVPCDGSCEHYNGSMKNFGEERDNTDTGYPVKEIIESADSFTE